MKVSCLMVTQPGRESLADRAIADFLAQDWPDRELVVVSDGVIDPRHRRWLGTVAARADQVTDNLQRVAIVVAAIPLPKSLGALRNVATGVARGEILLQWDDDDRYHPRRVSIQAAPLVDDPTLVGTCLTSQLYYFAAHRHLYWVDWHNRRPKYAAVRIPGTLCVRASTVRDYNLRYPEDGDVASRGEDGAFLSAVVAAVGRVVELDADLGWCYLRQYHGANTWGRGRFLANAHWLGLTAAEVDVPARRGLVDEAVVAAGLDGEIHVMGRDRPAYTIPERGGDGDGAA